MRVLASVIPGSGHLLPLLPTLHALRDAGDTVLVASAEPLRAEVEAAGLDFAAVGPPGHESDADALLSGFRTAGSARVHAARFVPQQDVLAAAAAVVCHAGVGTVYGALSVGVPLVVAPLAADQPICAMGCVLAGAAVSLAPVPPPERFLAYVTDPTAVTATQVSEATTRVLETPAHRQAAQRIAAEIAAAPRPPPSGHGLRHSRVPREVAGHALALSRLPGTRRAAWHRDRQLQHATVDRPAHLFAVPHPPAPGATARFRSAMSGCSTPTRNPAAGRAVHSLQGHARHGGSTGRAAGLRQGG